MLKKVFKELDIRIEEYNQHAEGTKLSKCNFQIVGQTALIEAHINLNLTATQDVDAFTKANHWVTNQFDDILKKYGKHFDQLSHEIWMPSETEYTAFYQGKYIHAEIAKPEYVLISKALKAPEKNKMLLTQYLVNSSDLFFKLASKYKFNIEKFLNE